MLPKQAVYIIEEYKFEVGAVFILSMIALMIPLIHKAQDDLTAGRLSSAAVYEEVTYPIINKQVIPQVAAATQQHLESGSQVWPIHGLVTTQFGVPHRPWQDRHTGIDISSRARSGVTPVTVFREGTVIKTIRQYSSYGYHVIVDHGNGLTSLYGHLSSISVIEGQHVRPGDMIGREGSTGASTGTHLHFEIRLNGTPVNPRQYFSDNP